MIKKNTIFDYLAQVMIVYGISVICLCAFCLLFGEDAKGHSSIFALGNAGIPAGILGQFLWMAMIISGLRWLFFTDVLIRNLSILLRSILMFICVILSVGIFAAVFGWFPVDQVLPWMMFFICFFVCAFISVGVSVLKEKSDNRKMQEALERMKGED
ncbi:MAG: hypothetical protein ACI4AA_08340 [Lachnospiraceae bacterium]